MFKTRLMSSVILVIVLGSVLFLGGNVLFLFTLALSLVAYREMINATGVRLEGQHVNALEVAGGLGILAYYGIRFFANTETYIMLTITMTIIGLLFVYVFCFPKYDSRQVMAALFSYLYAPIMLAYMYLTRELESGIYLVWLIFISSWVCDTCAYLVGMTIGKHKLAPRLSPKKSVEGAIGGVVGAMLVGLLYAYILLRIGVVKESFLVVFPVVSAVGAVISQIGDLAASAVKRNHGIKDYGRLIPGHGGVMDRFDSVIFTAPMVYYLVIFLLHGNL